MCAGGGAWTSPARSPRWASRGETKKRANAARRTERGIMVWEGAKTCRPGKGVKVAPPATVAGRGAATFQYGPRMCAATSRA